MNKDRGVVLVYVVMLITLTAYLAALMLNSTMSRKMSSKITADSTQAQADTGTAQAIMTSCLADSNWPSADSCSAAPVGCLTGAVFGSPPATFRATLCAAPANPPCRFVINVCRVTLNDANATCDPPTCP